MTDASDEVMSAVTGEPVPVAVEEIARPAALSRRRARWVAASGALALVCVTASLVVPSGPRIGTVTQAADGSGSGTPLTSPDPGLPPEVLDPVARAVALDELLRARGLAITRDDAPAWGSQQTPSARVHDFDDLSVLPITRWQYTIDSVTTGADPSEVSIGATVAYRFDVDGEDALVREKLTMRHTDDGWRVAAESTDSARAQPWDLGTVRVARGASSLVVGIDVGQQTLDRYADLADSVAGDVTAVWGDQWTGRPVVVVPRTTAMLGQGLARAETGLARIAAVTTAEDGDDNRVDLRGADRVWTNTPVMASLSALGREIVLRHEVLHAATGAAATSATPLWLEEGYAEYVGYLGSGVPLSTATADVLRAVRAGRGPDSLPTPAEFSGPRLAEAYESAHVACDLVVDEVGLDGLARIYRRTARGTDGGDQNVDSALREVLGYGIEAFEARWRARLRALAG